ncbi:MAG: DUF3775 domain-containing protein [Hyphomicrobium sp.]|nr:DUF3775 domain-containing protein [Hyphomicrobium sp.]
MAEPQIAPDMSLPVDYVERLAFKASGVQGREAVTDPDSGSNATDDDMIDALQDTPGDLSRQEIAKEIAGLDDRQQAELVALFWIGRGDFEPEEWEEAIGEALARREVPTPVYLMGQPLLGTMLVEGLERLGLASDLPSATV